MISAPATLPPLSLAIILPTHMLRDVRCRMYQQAPVSKANKKGSRGAGREVAAEGRLARVVQ